jgi:hypothetical protein
VEIGIVKISPFLLLLLVVAAICAALLHFVGVRRARLHLQAVRGSAVVRANAWLRVLLGLRSFAIVATVSPLAVILIYASAQWRIENSAHDPARIQAVIGTRDLLERFLGRFMNMTAGAWVMALVLLFLVWLAVRYSRSHSRWTSALQARRKAYEELLAPQSTDALLAKAKELDTPKFNSLYAATLRVIEANRAKVRAAESAHVFSLSSSDGEEIPMSVNQLRTTIEQIEREAAVLESGAPPQTS